MQIYWCRHWQLGSDSKFEKRIGVWDENGFSTQWKGIEMTESYVCFLILIFNFFSFYYFFWKISSTTTMSTSMATIFTSRHPTTTKLALTLMHYLPWKWCTNEGAPRTEGKRRATQGFYFLMVSFFFFGQISYLSSPYWHKIGPNDRLYTLFVP